MEQTCNICKQSFPMTTEYFYNNPTSKKGIGMTCKPCYIERANERVKKIRLAGGKEYDRLLKKVRRYTKKHHSKVYARETMRMKRATDPKYKAHEYARNVSKWYYIRNGRLPRKSCEQCGKDNAQMHHEDYEKPLEVMWLCRTCHSRHHMLKRYESLSPSTHI